MGAYKHGLTVVQAQRCLETMFSFVPLYGVVFSVVGRVYAWSLYTHKCSQ